jgi:hypothetical protein
MCNTIRQTPDTIRGTNGINTSVRADPALHLWPCEPSDSKRKRKKMCNTVLTNPLKRAVGDGEVAVVPRDEDAQTIDASEETRVDHSTLGSCVGEIQ